MNMQMVKDFCVDLVFPNRCPFCDKFIKWDKLSCDICFDKIEWVMDDEFPSFEMNFDVCFSAAYYSGVAKHAVLNLKVHHETGYAKIIAGELASKLFQHGYDKADMIIAVPMSKKSLEKLGLIILRLFAMSLLPALVFRKTMIFYLRII